MRIECFRIGRRMECLKEKAWDMFSRENDQVITGYYKLNPPPPRETLEKRNQRYDKDVVAINCGQAIVSERLHQRLDRIKRVNNGIYDWLS